MAYDFPASPAADQEFTPSGGPTYVWKSPRWMVKSAAPVGATVSATAPTSPASGAFWWNTTTKTLNVWDGTAWQVVFGTWA